MERREILPTNPEETLAAGLFRPQTPVETWGPGTILLGDFEVERLLGQGGMGSVFLVKRRRSPVRFAVKTLLSSNLTDLQQKRLFLRELRTWIDMPEHVNLTGCRFFRTVEDRLAIFAEYVEGCSLKEKIVGTERLPAKEILDIAIQFAWGLEVAHATGVIHQDVKPANLLLGSQGIAKVTDFGLSRARGLFEASAPGSGPSPQTSFGGLTPAYCSPEQSRQEELDHRTDIWSFGLSLLEMWTGPADWLLGALATEILEHNLDRTVHGEGRRFPEGMVHVLRRCFREDPGERWGSIREVGEVLREVYRQEAGEEHPRMKPDPPEVVEAPRRARERITLTGTSWDDPVWWLRQALRAAGRPLDEAEAIPPATDRTRAARLLADLEILEEALGLFKEVIQAGTDHGIDLARLLHQKGLVHGEMDDLPGALASFDSSIARYEERPDLATREDLQFELAKTMRSKAIIQFETGAFQEVAATYERAIPLLELKAVAEPGSSHAHLLATLWQNLANALHYSDQTREAIRYLDRARSILESRQRLNPDEKVLGDLCVLSQNQATMLFNLGELREALSLFDQAITLREELATVGGKREHRIGLAHAYTNKGCVLTYLGRHEEAIEAYRRAVDRLEAEGGLAAGDEIGHDLSNALSSMSASLVGLEQYRTARDVMTQAVEIREKLVHQRGRTKMSGALASGYMNLGVILGHLEEHEQCLERYDRALELLEGGQSRETPTTLTETLGMLHANRALALQQLDRPEEAREAYRRSLEFYHRLVHQEEHPEFVGGLARTQRKLASLLLALGERGEARRLALEAVAVLERELERTGRVEWADELEKGRWILDQA